MTVQTFFRKLAAITAFAPLIIWTKCDPFEALNPPEIDYGYTDAGQQLSEPPDMAGPYYTQSPIGWPGYDEAHPFIQAWDDTCTCPVCKGSCFDWGACAPHKERNSSSADWCSGSYGPWIPPCYRAPVTGPAPEQPVE